MRRRLLLLVFILETASVWASATSALTGTCRRGGARAGAVLGNAARRDRSARAQDAAAERGAEIARSDPKRGAAQSRWCRRQNPPSQAACRSPGRAKPSGHAATIPAARPTQAPAVGHPRRGRISMRRSATRLSLPVTLLAAG